MPLVLWTHACLLAHLWNSRTPVCSTEIVAHLFVCLRRSIGDLHAVVLLSHHLSTSIYPFIYPLAHLRAEDSISACLWVTGGKGGDPETQGKNGDVIDIQRFDGLSVSGKLNPLPPSATDRQHTWTHTHARMRDKTLMVILQQEAWTFHSISGKKKKQSEFT